MNRQLKIFIGIVIVTLLAAAVIVAALFMMDSRKDPEPPSTDIPGWQIVPADQEGARDRITNEQYAFAAEAPDGWRAALLNSTLVGVGREDFPECSMTLRLGSNDGLLSASGLTEQLNPPGPKPQEKHRYVGTIVVGGWPAAVLTTIGLVENVTKEVDIPKGNILFIAEMRLKAFGDEQRGFIEHPRRKECEDIFEGFLGTFQITQ